MTRPLNLAQLSNDEIDLRIIERDSYEFNRNDANLPALVINEADPTATAKKLAKLIAKRDDFLFNGHTLIRIVSEADSMPRAVGATTEAVRVVAHEICSPTKIRHTKHGEERVAVPLNRDIAQLYLNGLEGRWGVRSFLGIATAPLLKNDGTIRGGHGHDPETGLFCHNIPDLNIPERPTEADAKAALLRLRRFFRTFPFADSIRVVENGLEITDLTQPPGLDESSFLVALLTAVTRQSLDLAPGFLCDAPAFSGAGTGKGLLVKSACVVGSGVRPSAFTSGHDEEEFDKRLTAALTEAHPAVFLDNFNAKELKSDTLASALTENPAMVRPMGHTKTVPLHTRTFIGITGNSVEIAEDMARRIIVTHLDAKMENPEQRKFEPGFLDRVLDSRSALLSDALTIWRWGRQTVLKAGLALGSYEQWAQWCRDPLLALGMRDPVERIAEIKAADPRRRALVAILDAWWTAHADNIVLASELDPSVIELIDMKAGRKADGSLQFSHQRVTGFLGRHSKTRVGGYALIAMKDKTGYRPLVRYKLQRDRPASE